MGKIYLLSGLLFFLYTGNGFAQDDLEAIVNNNEGPVVREYVKGAFKGTRVVNLHSLEKVAPGALQFMIQHRFGTLNGGAYNLYGLDHATMRLGLEYGINNLMMVGLGRSSYQKTYDGFVKISLLRQSKGTNGFPLSVLYFGSITLNTLKSDDQSRNSHFSSRLACAHQLIIGAKLTEHFSFEVVPSFVHRNLVVSSGDANDLWAVGSGFRYKLTKRISLNGEYIYRLPLKSSSPAFRNNYNSMSVGFDIETGGHVFQLHLTNSLPMIEKGFIGETTEKWWNGGIHLGFNISRDFVLRGRNKKKKEEKE